MVPQYQSLKLFLLENTYFSHWIRKYDPGGGFIAPFQELSGKGTAGAFDFRLPNVLSISASGHKFGESICGTGWVVFRQRENLAEHIAVTVT